MIHHCHIIVLLGVLLTFLFWKEVRRNNKARLVWRLLVSLIAVCCLGLFAWPNFDRSIGQNEQRTYEAILLTEGYDPDSVKSLINAMPTNTPVYSTVMGVSENHELNNVQVLSDLSIFSVNAQWQQIHMFGHGLTADQLTSVRPAKIIFHLSPVSGGLSTVHWKKNIYAGENFKLEGSFQNSLTEQSKLLLVGPAGIEDSFIVRSKTMNAFSLRTIPRLTGRALYHLVMISGKDTIEKDPVPFNIYPATASRILLLSSSPGFEVKFLKNWLSTHGYALTVKTNISRGKVAREFMNTTDPNASRITKEYINNFDAVVADADLLASLSNAELDAIRSSVEKSGVGLLIRTDSSIDHRAFYAQAFPIFQEKHDAVKSYTIFSPDSPSAPATIMMSNPYYIQHKEGTQVLLHDGHLDFAAAVIFGLGKLAMTTLGNTYTLALSGNEKNYAALWSGLLENVIRPADAKNSWSISPEFAYVNEAATITLQSGSIENPEAFLFNNPLHFKQDQLIHSNWETTYWPRKEGWQEIGGPAIVPYWWYSYGPDDWKKYSARLKTDATNKYVSKYSGNTNFVQTGNAVSWLVSMRIYFFIAFIFCAAFLWVEQKI